jgi:hypothetical protein
MGVCAVPGRGCRQDLFVCRVVPPAEGAANRNTNLETRQSRRAVPVAYSGTGLPGLPSHYPMQRGSDPCLGTITRRQRSGWDFPAETRGRNVMAIKRLIVGKVLIRKLRMGLLVSGIGSLLVVVTGTAPADAALNVTGNGMTVTFVSAHMVNKVAVDVDFAVSCTPVALPPGDSNVCRRSRSRRPTRVRSRAMWGESMVLATHFLRSSVTERLEYSRLRSYRRTATRG